MSAPRPAPLILSRGGGAAGAEAGAAGDRDSSDGHSNSSLGVLRRDDPFPSPSKEYPRRYYPGEAADQNHNQQHPHQHHSSAPLSQIQPTADVPSSTSNPNKENYYHSFPVVSYSTSNSSMSSYYGAGHSKTGSLVGLASTGDDPVSSPGKISHRKRDSRAGANVGGVAGVNSSTTSTSKSTPLRHGPPLIPIHTGAVVASATSTSTKASLMSYIPFSPTFTMNPSPTPSPVLNGSDFTTRDSLSSSGTSSTSLDSTRHLHPGSSSSPTGRDGRSIGSISHDSESSEKNGVMANRRGGSGSGVSGMSCMVAKRTLARSGPFSIRRLVMVTTFLGVIWYYYSTTPPSSNHRSIRNPSSSKNSFLDRINPYLAHHFSGHGAHTSHQSAYTSSSLTEEGVSKEGHRLPVKAQSHPQIKDHGKLAASSASTTSADDRTATDTTTGEEQDGEDEGSEVDFGAWLTGLRRESEDEVAAAAAIAAGGIGGAAVTSNRKEREWGQKPIPNQNPDGTVNKAATSNKEEDEEDEEAGIATGADGGVVVIKESETVQYVDDEGFENTVEKPAIVVHDIIKDRKTQRLAAVEDGDTNSDSIAATADGDANTVNDGADDAPPATPDDDIEGTAAKAEPLIAPKTKGKKKNGGAVTKPKAATKPVAVVAAPPPPAQPTKVNPYDRVLSLTSPSRRYLYGANFQQSKVLASKAKGREKDENNNGMVSQVPNQQELKAIWQEGKKMYEEEEDEWKTFKWNAPKIDQTLQSLINGLKKDELQLRNWIRELQTAPATGVGLGSVEGKESTFPAGLHRELDDPPVDFVGGSLAKWEELMDEKDGGFSGKCKGGKWMDDYRNMHREMLSGTRTPKFISYHCERGMNCGGLGDRLLAMTSAFFFGLITNRAFLAEWQTPIPLDVVFDSPQIDWTFSSFNSMHHPVLGERKLAKHAAELDIIHFDRGTMDAVFRTTNWNPKKGRRPTAGLEKRDIAFQSPWIKFYSNRGMIYRSFAYKHLQSRIEHLGLRPMSAFSCILNYLFRPKKEALDLITEYTSVLALPTVFSIGIQIRTGDLSMKDPEYDLGNTVERHSAFFGCARQLADTYAHSGQKVVYYLVTDSANLKQDAMRVLGDSLIMTNMVPEHVHQKSGHADGVFTAVVEDWILAKTDMRVITQDSGFGKLATFAAAKRASTVTLFPSYNLDVRPYRSKHSHVSADCRLESAFSTFDEIASEWSLG